MHRVSDNGDFLPEENTMKQNSRTCQDQTQAKKQCSLVCVWEIGAGGGEVLATGDLVSSSMTSYETLGSPHLSRVTSHLRGEICLAWLFWKLGALAYV